ncbi:MAG: hypothetical protein WC645_08320 [Candidatus Margulisiibacteriota bacterium]
MAGEIKNVGYVAVLFYYQRPKVENRPCFDVRVDAQMLPGGATVCGFFCEDLGRHEVVEVFSLPYLDTEEQEGQADQAIAWCRWYVNGGWDSAVDNQPEFHAATRD